MIEVFGCILLVIIDISFILMAIDELKTNYKIRKSLKDNSYEVGENINERI